MPPLEGSISAAKRLKTLRIDKGMTQYDIELSGILTQPNYSRIENGKAHPSRETLNALLDLFTASFNSRQEITKCFGYLPDYPLPILDEIERVSDLSQPALDSVPMPAYLEDFVTRFLGWNRLFAKLLGVYEGNGVLAEMQNMPLFKAQFDSRVRLADYIENIDAYLLAEMQSIRQRLVPYKGERGYEEFVAELCQEPTFDTYWQATQGTLPHEDVVTEFAARVLEPVRFKVPGFDTSFHFYAYSDAVIGDERFSIVHMIPADGFTFRQIERWQKDDILR